jgi:hypothetical protein
LSRWRCLRAATEIGPDDGDDEATHMVWGLQLARCRDLPQWTSVHTLSLPCQGVVFHDGAACALPPRSALTTTTAMHPSRLTPFPMNASCVLMNFCLIYYYVVILIQKYQFELGGLPAWAF